MAGFLIAVRGSRHRTFRAYQLAAALADDVHEVVITWDKFELWTVGALDFISHCTDQADAVMRENASVLMGDSTRAMQGRTVLVNLGADVPAQFEGFARLIEIVDADPAHRQQARARWRTYQAQGHTLLQHDFQKKAQA